MWTEAIRKDTHETGNQNIPAAPAAFQEGVHRIYAECDPRNIPSWHLLEHLGFRREAHFRQNLYFHKDRYGMPIWKDTYVYAMLENDETERRNQQHV